MLSLEIKAKPTLMAILGSAILAFGMFNIHSVASITEGGVLGASLLFEKWFDVTPAYSSFILNALCYLFGFRILGKDFIIYSAISAIGFSAVYAICEWVGPLFPQIANYPVIAAILGSLFVGVGVGLCVRVKAAPSGDDALALSLSSYRKIKIETVYLVSDIVVLLLSLSYIPLSEIWYSLLTIFLSGKIIGIIQRF